MPQNAQSVGDPIQARCSKCRKNSNHSIVSMNDDGPDTVQCTTCDYKHKYKPPVTPKTAAQNLIIKNKEAKRRQKEKERKEWSALKPDMEKSKAQAYSMTAAYNVKSLIKHPVFGLGQVQRVAGPQKVEVLFEDGIKTMRCK